MISGRNTEYKKACRCDGSSLEIEIKPGKRMACIHTYMYIHNNRATHFLACVIMHVYVGNLSYHLWLVKMIDHEWAYINPDLISISSQTLSSASHTPQHRTRGYISRAENPASRDACIYPLGALDPEKISSDWWTAVIDGPFFFPLAENSWDSSNKDPPRNSLNRVSLVEV